MKLEKGKRKEKSKAQRYLERVQKLDAMIQNKLIEKQQWKDLALSITANMGGERVSASSGSMSRMADALDKCIDAEDQIAKAVDKLAKEKQEIVATIEALDSPTEYKLLHLRYVQFIDLIDIANAWGKDYTTITTAHGRALRHVQDILDAKKGGA